jgi:HJR/Mrr/RecB family endonuclease
MHDDGKRKAEIITFFKTDGASGHGPEWEAYRWLRSELRNKFEEYHSANRCLESDETLDLKRLTGPQFETYVGRTLEKRGYDIRYTPRTGDQGGDLIAKKDGRTIVVQAKRSSRPVGNDAVQEVTAALKIYSGDEGWVVTNATFTPAAKKLAHANVVRLIDGVELRSLAGGS